MFKFLFATLCFAFISYSTGAIATGDDFRTYHEKKSAKKYVLDESKLDTTTLKLLNIARERGETDPRLKTFSKSFEWNLARLQSFQERDKNHKRLIIVGQLKDFDHSLPMSGSCYILDYGVFVGCSIMEPVKKKNGEETGRFTSGYWFFDRSFQHEPIEEKITIKFNGRSVHVGAFPLVPRDPDSFVTIQGKAETGLSSIGIRYNPFPKIREVEAQFEPKTWIWYPVSPDGTFSMGPLPPHRYGMAAREGDNIIEKTGDYVPIDKKNSQEILRVKKWEVEGLVVFFGDDLPEIPLPIVLRVDGSKYKEAVKLSVQAIEKMSRKVLEEETFDIDERGKAEVNLKAFQVYNFHLLDRNGNILASRKSMAMGYSLRRPVLKRVSQAIYFY